MEFLLKYFQHLTPRQREQFAALETLYAEWNARINVISRKDMGEFYLRHVLHSLAIARMLGVGGELPGEEPESKGFADGARVIDIGTGGGFPAVPLAILFPGAHFTAVDSIAKKIGVVTEVARQLGLDNVEAVCARAENLPGRFDYAVSRAVAPAATLLGWVWNKIERGRAGTLPNGVILLKGGDLAEELAATGRRPIVQGISAWFDEEFFETKKVIYFEK